MKNIFYLIPLKSVILRCINDYDHSEQIYALNTQVCHVSKE